MTETFDLARLQQHDDAEWARLEAAFADRLLAYARRRVADPEACDDILQETLLGAVRGIARFDEQFGMEQYLFGICRNRTIDHLRRGARGRGFGQAALDEEELDILEQLPEPGSSPSSIVHRAEVAQHGGEVLQRVLVDWVAESWQAGEYQRLLIVEALLLAGRRNRDLARELGIEDETAVAGVKFRALKRMAALAKEHAGGSTWALALMGMADGSREVPDLATLWRSGRVSCPARHWLARWNSGLLDAGPAAFLQAHVEAHGCPFCKERRKALEATPEPLARLSEALRLSQMGDLRSRVLPPDASRTEPDRREQPPGESV